MVFLLDERKRHQLDIREKVINELIKNGYAYKILSLVTNKEYTDKIYDKQPFKHNSKNAALIHSKIFARLKQLYDLVYLESIVKTDRFTKYLNCNNLRTLDSRNTRKFMRMVKQNGLVVESLISNNNEYYYRLKNKIYNILKEYFQL